LDRDPESPARTLGGSLAVGVVLMGGRKEAIWRRCEVSGDMCTAAVGALSGEINHGACGAGWCPTLFSPQLRLPSGHPS
jgi:hypothetical protein